MVVRHVTYVSPLSCPNETQGLKLTLVQSRSTNFCASPAVTSSVAPSGAGRLKLNVELVNLQGSKVARQHGSKAARQHGSKAARQQGSKVARSARQHGSTLSKAARQARQARQQGSKVARQHVKQGSEVAR